jgi:peptide/nickel transport system substrate-binding protein
MHTEEGAKSAAQPIVAAITTMKKMNDHQIQFTLAAGNADFPFLLSDYHILMYPAGMIDEAIAKGIGTGLYKVVSFDPGVRCVLTRVDSHYKDGRAGWFDEIECIAINDSSARMNALMTGQVDAVNRVDFKTEPLLRANPNVEIFEVTGNMHYTFPMLTNQAPFDDVNVRKALKYGLNRQEMVDKILQGHGMVGNDHPIGPANQYLATDIPQIEFDADKAKFHMKAAGLTELNVGSFLPQTRPSTERLMPRNCIKPLLKVPGLILTWCKNQQMAIGPTFGSKRVGALATGLAGQRKTGCSQRPMRAVCLGTIPIGRTPVSKSCC